MRTYRALALLSLSALLLSLAAGLPARGQQSSGPPDYII